MSASMEDAVRRAEQELMSSQAKLKTIRERLQGSVTKVRSKDKMVTVTLDMHGFVEAVDFHTKKFRTMAPAELGAVLAQTIRQAQTQARERVLRAYQPILPPGLLDGPLDDVNLEKYQQEALEKTRRKVTELASRPLSSGGLPFTRPS
jgi:DNA-binding protein YbaB